MVQAPPVSIRNFPDQPTQERYPGTPAKEHIKIQDAQTFVEVIELESMVHDIPALKTRFADDFLNSRVEKAVYVARLEDYGGIGAAAGAPDTDDFFVGTH